MQINEHTTAGPEENEFDRLFSDEQADPTSNVDAEPSKGEESQQAEVVAGESAGDGEAPGEAGGEEGEPQASQPGAETITDWLEALPEEVRTRIETERAEAAAERKKVEDRYNALHGRLAPVQQALSDAQRRLRERELAQQEQRPASTQDSVPDSYFDSDGWKQWAEDFPGDAKVLRTALEAQRQKQETEIRQLKEQVQSIAGRIGQAEEATIRQSLESEEAKLEAVHPDWREVNQSDEFWDWFDGYRSQQPKSVRGMYYDKEHLQTMFADSEFAADMIGRYKETIATPTVTQPPATQTDSTQTPAPTQPGNARLAMSRAPDVRGSAQVPRAVALDSLPPEKQFEHLWNQSE